MGSVRATDVEVATDQDQKYNILTGGSWISFLAKSSIRQTRHSRYVQPNDERPIFIPDFSSLRQQAINASEQRLRSVERLLAALEPVEEERREQMLDLARVLIRQLDEQIEAQLRTREIGQPQYANGLGMSIIKFQLNDQSRTKWTMLDTLAGTSSTSIFDALVGKPDDNSASSMQDLHVKNFAHSRFCSPTAAYLKRSKTFIENQRGVMKEEDDHKGSYVARKSLIVWWYIVFALAVLVWVAFYTIGIIAADTTFNAAFIKYFYWIAVVWSLAPSLLLAWLIHAFGGDGRDVVSGFLANVAIYLIMIQFGQSHLLLQSSAS